MKIEQAKCVIGLTGSLTDNLFREFGFHIIGVNDQRKDTVNITVGKYEKDKTVKFKDAQTQFIFEMELAEIDDAQCSLRLDVRQQLRLYPHVKINDMLDGEPVSEDQEWEYVNEEIQLEGRNFEDLDEHFTAFEVPITFFGDHFTLCFSPYKITVREGNTMLKIPEATEYHVVFNALLDCLTDKAKRKASEWRKEQVLARLEKK